MNVANIKVTILEMKNINGKFRHFAGSLAIVIKKSTLNCILE
jgi:hypothetical protein